MIRSAAKNYESVTVVVDPADYDVILEDMRDHEGGTTLKLRERLAIKAFIKTSDYDRAIGSFLNQEQSTEGSFSLSLPLVTRLRYGENPHQSAALYGDFDQHFKKLHGKELSFNNILDISAAANLIAEFTEPTIAILKHTNPCGVGTDPDLREAWEKAFATDKQAPFGGVIVCNRPVNEALAKAISEIFSEVIIAPSFETEARSLFQKKKNLRLIRALKPPESDKELQDVRSVAGGLLAQERDRPTGRSRDESGHESETDRGRNAGNDLRVAGGETREVECHCLCGVGPHPWDRRGTDVSSGRVPHRGLEGHRKPACSSREARWRATRSFHFPMASSRRRRLEPPARSSQAVPCATKKSSPQRTIAAWP